VSSAPIGTPNTKDQSTNPNKLRIRYWKSLVFVGVIATGLISSLVLTVLFQYIPYNTTTIVLPLSYPASRSIDMITLAGEPLISVPFKSIVWPVNSDLTVTIYHHALINDSMDVQKVTLSSPPGSILTYNSQFDNRTPDLPKSSYHVDSYVLDVTAKHNLEIGNMSGTYRLNIFYVDPKNPPISNVTVATQAKPNTTTGHITLAKSGHIGNTKLTSQLAKVLSTSTIQSMTLPNETIQYYSAKFNWPIKTMDLTTLTYFWIVLIGVILSKLTTMVNAQQGSSESGPIQSLMNKDYLWIGISAIIALIIFSSFQQQVHLTGNILYNVSLAFAFGFGFDRILDTTSNLVSKKTG
jgi:hypothetical protein